MFLILHKKRMFTRTFAKPKKSFTYHSEDSCRSGSISEYDDCIVGLMDNLPLISCENHRPLLSLKEVLRTSVGVMGESNWGLTEKVVLSNGRLCALKRFRKAMVGKSEFGRRVESLAQVSSKSEYLVPITVYLYAKRIKLVLCDYYPMGSLADLLAAGRRGQTALNWNERLTIIVQIARAIAFIHAQSPPSETKMKMNVHGDIKSSNVMLNIDLTARLSDYGFVQLAACVEDPEKDQPAKTSYSENLNQKNDIFKFGLVLLDMLAGVREPGYIKSILDTKESIKQGKNRFFEFHVHGKERKQALKVLDIALACTNRLPEARPSIQQILLNLSDIFNSNNKQVVGLC